MTRPIDRAILTPQFQHECWEWDCMEINEFQCEFESCLCFDDPSARFHRNMWSLSHDLYNRMTCGEPIL